MNKLIFMEKVYQVLEITDKNLIQVFLDYSMEYIEKDLLRYEEVVDFLTPNNISKLLITTYDIENDGFNIKFNFNDNIDRYIFVDNDIVMEYLLDNNLIDYNPNMLILSKMDLLDRRIKDILLRNISVDIDELKVLIVKEELKDKLIEFGFRKENIILINNYSESEVDLIYIDDLNNLESYKDILVTLIKKGVYLLALKNGINFISYLDINLNYELTDDVVLVILNNEQYKYDLKNYHGLIERKRSLEDFKKIVNDLTGEPEICLNVKDEKYWIIKYKDYITLYHNSVENEIKFQDIDDLINSNNLFDFKNNWDLIDSIILDDCIDL